MSGFSSHRFKGLGPAGFPPLNDFSQLKSELEWLEVAMNQGHFPHGPKPSYFLIVATGFCVLD